MSGFELTSDESATKEYGCLSPVVPIKHGKPIITKEFLIKVASEFIGTFILLIGCAGSAMMNEKTHGELTYNGVGAAAGLVVMMVILSTGHVSGAHVNPAVTIAFATFKHFSWVEVPIYIISQVLGSICASYVLFGIFNPIEMGGVTLPTGSIGQSFGVEVLLTFILMFVVMSVSTDTRAVGELAGIAVGVTVILNNLVAAGISGASMNPVRSLGPAIVMKQFSSLWIYIIAPVIGALLGGGTYCLLKSSNDDSTKSTKEGSSIFRNSP